MFVKLTIDTPSLFVYANTLNKQLMLPDTTSHGANSLSGGSLRWVRKNASIHYFISRWLAFELMHYVCVHLVIHADHHLPYMAHLKANGTTRKGLDTLLYSAHCGRYMPMLYVVIPVR